jgi:hypothetical protein
MLTYSAPNAVAQTWNRFSVFAGGGFTPVTGTLGNRLDTGWNVLVGGGYKFTNRVGANVEFQYHGLGVQNHVLNELQVPNGNAHVWSIGLSPIIMLRPSESRFSPYVTAGGGYYRRTVEFTEPTSTFINIFDPWWGWIGPVEVPANRVLGRVSRGGPGFNVGGGFAVRLGESNTQFFAEARYHYASTTGAITRMVPVTLGLRW